MPAAYHHGDTLSSHSNMLDTAFTVAIVRLMGTVILVALIAQTIHTCFFHIVHALAAYLLSGLFAAYRLVESGFADVIVK
ncbi:hypothetical protein JBW_01661 [Pelosinus fermentans JBW45]|uniref:Uncharacterized protein n=1 Tax=Pelosinus fermentans JBW45 TaxID=1192197 RepID=I8U1U9_9FIRM|nr:hypothetical protein JBW_01661 [Pelosinus fermentans JBW45]